MPAPGQAQRRAMLGAFDANRRELIVRTSATTKRSTDFIALLEQLERRYGPAAPRPRAQATGASGLVRVLDNGPIHTGKITTKALTARAAWLTVEWLPK